MAIAQIAGVVSDTTGAAIPGAQVTATETDKQMVRTTVSDGQGRYFLPNLPVGPYKLEVTASGFKSYVQSGIVLQVGNNVTINVTMQLGAISEHIEVTAAASMVETRENTIAQVIDEKRIMDLPLNGRQATQLILLSGAAVATGGGGMVGSKNYFSSVTISVAGGQQNGVNYLLDGGDHNDAMTNVNMPMPFPDALQEFSVQTSALPARYGLHPGAVVNAVTKSGTNDWHGDLFEFLRNGNVNARNTFAAMHDTLKRNQYGGTFGGKIIRDKLFFFGGVQNTVERSDPPQTISYVPTAAVMAGDFSTIVSGNCVSGGKGKTLTDPTTKTPFADNLIPVSRFNPQALSVLKYIPQSDNACGKITYGIPKQWDELQAIGRVDWVQNSKHTMYGRYFLAQYKILPVFDGKNALTTTTPGNWERAQTVTLGDTYSFSGTTLNAFHATFSRRRDDRGVALNYINPGTVGLNNVYAPIPNFLQMSVSNYWSVGCGTCAAGFFNSNSWHFADDVDIIRGRHQLSFGIDFLRDQFNFANGWIVNGSWSFNGINTGDALADYMLGAANDYTQSNYLQMAARVPVLALYAQDSIKLTPHLTMNAGIRWEPSFAVYDYFGHGTSFLPAAFNAGAKSQVFTNAPPGLMFYGDPGIPKGYFNDVLSLFSPRIGLVFDPKGDGKQTIRVSGAILRDTAELFYSERLTTNAPYGSQIDIPNPAGGMSNPYQGYPGGNPFPMPYPPPKTFTFAPYSVFVNMPLNTKPTYTGQWNISYQRQITANWMASLAYLGNKTTHVWVGEDINPAVYMPGATTGNTNQRRLLYLQNPTAGSAYASIVQSDQGANAHYNGMLVSVQHRMANNFSILFNYTWSHCTSDGDFNGELAGNYYMDPNNRARDKGDCLMDVRHLANTSMMVASPMSGNGLIGHILSGWQWSPIITAATGAAINITSGTDRSLRGINLDRPNLVNTNPYSVDPNPRVWLNPAAFALNDLGTFGNLGKNAVHGPGRFNFDMSLTRTFRLTERFRLVARGEAFNVINHVNYNNPTTGLNSSNFGKILGAADPRILQFSMKLHF